MKILSAGQFRELDRFTIEHEPVASVDLMERAAEAVAAEIAARWPQDRRIVVFAGPGNNGGDALAVARLLTGRGYRTLSYLFNIKGTLTEDCATNRDRLAATEGAEWTEVTSQFDFPVIQPEQDIIVDGLFGIGLNKPLNGGFAAVTRRINESKAPVVSIDIPSGLMCEDNSYNDLSHVVRATLTLTMQLPKPAFFFAENRRYTGEWKTLDIGLSAQGIEQARTGFYLSEPEEMKAMLRSRPLFAHKGTMGHALLVCGSYGMAGAAILAARACLRSGVGKLTLHTAHRNLLLLQTTVPEAIVSPDSDGDIITHAIDSTRFQTVGAGPGIGTDEDTATALYDFILQQNTPMVLDADALTLLGRHPGWMQRLPAESLLTPHPKELEALTGHCSDSYERLTKARELAVRHNVYILVKGHYSLICGPTGTVWFNPTGNPGMATAGSGDVLTGLLTGLLAQGYAPGDALRLGVWLHGLAGDIAAERLGEECMLAGDIIEALPQAFKQIKETSSKNIRL